MFLRQFQKRKTGVRLLKAYFKEVLPEYDKERVYVSDIKKVILWYNLLQEKEMLDFSEEEEQENQEGEQEEKSSE